MVQNIFIFLLIDIKLIWHHLLKTKSNLHWNAFASVLCINYPHTCESSFGFSFLSCWFTCLSLCQYHADLRPFFFFTLVLTATDRMISNHSVAFHKFWHVVFSYYYYYIIINYIINYYIIILLYYILSLCFTKQFKSLLLSFYIWRFSRNLSIIDFNDYISPEYFYIYVDFFYI